MLPWQPVFDITLLKQILHFYIISVLIYWIWSLLDHFWRFLKVSENSRWLIQDGLLLRTKRYCDVIWCHHLMLWTSMETVLAYYVSFKFRCHSFNILWVKRWERNSPAPSHNSKKSPVWIGLILCNIVKLLERMLNIQSPFVVSVDVLITHWQWLFF